jgi:DNA-binding transcriptional LysR family regulator
MTFDQLVTFVSVAKTKNFTNTAEALHLTQPSVTNRIKNLEEELGRNLFNRNSKSLEMTRAGEKLLIYSNQIIDLIRKAQLDIGSESNEITIGATPTLGIYNLPKLVNILHKQDSQRNFVIKQGFSFQLLNMVISGNIDIALVLSRIEHPDIVVKKLKESLQIILVASTNHPILQEEKATCKTLGNYKVIKNASKGSFWKQINGLMLEHNLHLDSFVQVDSVEITKQLLQETDSLAFMPYQSVFKELQQGSLKPVVVEGIPAIEFPIYLIYHKNLLNSLIVEYLHDLMEIDVNEMNNHS